MGNSMEMTYRSKYINKKSLDFTKMKMKEVKFG